MKKFLSVVIIALLTGTVTIQAAAADTNPVETFHHELYKDRELSFTDQRDLCAEGIAELEERLATLQEVTARVEIDMLKQLYYQTMQTEKITLESFTEAMAALLKKEKSRLNVLERLAATCIRPEETPAPDAVAQRRARAHELREAKKNARVQAILDALKEEEGRAKEPVVNNVVDLSERTDNNYIRFIQCVLLETNELKDFKIGHSYGFNAGFCPVHGAVRSEHQQHEITKKGTFREKISTQGLLDNPEMWFHKVSEQEQERLRLRHDDEPTVLTKKLFEYEKRIQPAVQVRELAKALNEALKPGELKKYMKMQLLEALRYILGFEWSCQINPLPGAAEA